MGWVVVGVVKTCSDGALDVRNVRRFGCLQRLMRVSSQAFEARAELIERDVKDGAVHRVVTFATGSVEFVLASQPCTSCQGEFKTGILVLRRFQFVKVLHPLVAMAAFFLVQHNEENDKTTVWEAVGMF